MFCVNLYFYLIGIEIYTYVSVTIHIDYLKYISFKKYYLVYKYIHNVFQIKGVCMC